MTPKPQQQSRLSTGIPGLDEIMLGGLVPRRSYLVRGGPGAGKTTIGLHFLAEGVAAGEPSLYITMEESEERIRSNAAARGLDLTGVAILDISPSSDFFAASQSYDIFSPAEVEREPITQQIVESIESTSPVRVFVDPMTQYRYLAQDPFEFRRQVVSFLRFLVERGATVLFTSERSGIVADDDLQFMSDGVVDVTHNSNGRRLEVTKFRGSDFQAGLHTLKLVQSGVEVYPRLQPLDRAVEFEFAQISSGVPEIDEMMSGGIELGTITLISGPSGAGKTTLGMQFLCAAAKAGRPGVVYSFEEDEALTVQRCAGIGIPVREMIASGAVRFEKVEPLRFTSDEFASMVRRDVEVNDRKLVVLDSVAGYTLALRDDDLRPRMHALAKYLQARGVAVIILNEQETIFGDFRATEVGISYLADTIVVLRYLEMGGELRKAIAILKKRMSNYEKALREFQITRNGIRVGKPLRGLRGIFTGAPELTGDDLRLEGG